MAAATRDELRRKLLSSKERRRELIEIFGEQIEVVQPTLAEVLSVESGPDSKNNIADLMIRYCYVPGTDERVFEDGDKESILEWPMDSWAPVMTAAVERLSGMDVEAARKK